jgi:hypothetical protein
MLSVMDLVTIRRANMIPVLRHALLRHFSDFVGGRRGRIGRVGDTGCECSVVITVAASRTAAIFLFIVLFLRGHWLIETGPNDHPTICMPPDVKEH